MDAEGLPLGCIYYWRIVDCPSGTILSSGSASSGAWCSSLGFLDNCDGQGSALYSCGPQCGPTMTPAPTPTPTVTPTPTPVCNCTDLSSCNDLTTPPRALQVTRYCPGNTSSPSTWISFSDICASTVVKNMDTCDHNVNDPSFCSGGGCMPTVTPLPPATICRDVYECVSGWMYKYRDVQCPGNIILTWGDDNAWPGMSCSDGVVSALDTCDHNPNSGHSPGYTCP
jgi:hypothetical protein